MAASSGITGDIERFFDHHEDDAEVDLHLIAHAVEDLPENARPEGEKILSTPSGKDLQQRILGVLENGAVDLYGHLELLRTLRFLSQYPVTAYTYSVSSTVSRGERPSKAKLQSLAAQGFGATINLCAETPGGDSALIKDAGLDGRLQAFHIGIVDCNPPAVGQVVEMLDLVTQMQARGTRVYIHCEAGKARTGVMVACIRMALQGWSVKDALTEATNFGCTVPMQQAFIQSFGAMLQANRDAVSRGAAVPHPELGRYPLLGLGSTVPTRQQLTATLDSVAQSEKGGIE